MSRRFIDLFAGIGGMRLAFESAGMQCVFSSEIDRFAALTYAANFGELPQGDITRISADQIPPHDVLVGGFPCQPFSIAGVSKYAALGWQHGFEHRTKGTLFFDIARILAHHRPRAFLLENVKNLTSHNRGNTWRTIEDTLEELGYQLHVRVFDAALLVPQHRERVFIVGFSEPRDFNWPAIPNRLPTLSDILEASVDSKYTLTQHLWTYLQNYAEKHRARGNGFGFGLANPNGVTRTLSARYYKDGSEILIPQPGKAPRRLTPRECARLMGFPDSFEIPVSDTQAYRQFGNSVVVPLVSQIARQIAVTLDSHEGRTAEFRRRPRQRELLPATG